MNRKLQNSLGVVVALLSIFGISRSASALTNATLLATQDFSSTTFPPAGWTASYLSQYGGIYRSGNGNGGSNGSAGFDFYDCASENLNTPTLDASNYHQYGDTAYVEFDLFMERDYWDAGCCGADYLTVYAKDGAGGTSSTLAKLDKYNAYTYDNSSSYGYLTDPNTSSGWKHYKLGIPYAQRTSKLSIQWASTIVGGCGGNVFIDNVTITATHYNLLTLLPSPYSIDFGNANVGDTTAVKSFYIYNPNPVAVSLSGFQQTGNLQAFTIVHQPSNLAAGTPTNPTKDSISVRFNPQAGGVFFGGFSLNDNSDGPVQISGSFRGTGLAPIISINGTQNLFARKYTKLGQSLSQSFLITNTGVGFLKVFPSTYIGGDYPGEYRITRMPAVSGIPAGQSDTLTVMYHPTMEGSRPATLYIESNGGAEQQVSLRGVGTLPRLTTTDQAGSAITSLSFDSVGIGTQVCKTILLKNNGTDTLRILKNFFSSADYDFSLTPISGSDTMILPDQSKPVMVCFTPLAAGSRSATYRVMTNIPNTFETPSRDTSAFNIQIQGVGVPYGRLALSGMSTDSVIIGATDCLKDTIRNTGQSDLVVNSAMLSGTDSTEFALSNLTLPATIRPGGSQVFTFCFTPTQRGQRTTMLVVNTTSNSTTQTLNIPVNGVGLAVCASTPTKSLFDANKTLVGNTDSATVTVTNCGDVATTYTGALGSGSSEYSVSGSTTSPMVQPGGSTTYTLHFTPTDRNQANSTFTITGGTGVTPLVVNLGGTGGGVTASATGSVPDTKVGDCSQFDITITNNGNVDWTPGTATVGGANASDYTVVSGPTPSTIAPGNSATITVKFCATTVGSETATLTFPQGSPLASPSFTENLNGTGLATQGVAEKTEQQGFILEQSHPNPMSTTSDIGFTLPTSAEVRMDILDQTGKVIRTVVDSRMSEGYHSVTLNNRDLASGTYYYVLQGTTATTGTVQLMRQMVVIK